jgi:hypothetical protein
MKRTGSATGTREELTAELRDAAEGWAHQGRADLAEQAAQGAEEIAAGANSAQVGHICYRVEP